MRWWEAWCLLEIKEGTATVLGAAYTSWRPLPDEGIGRGARYADEQPGVADDGTVHDAAWCAEGVSWVAERAIETLAKAMPMSKGA